MFQVSTILFYLLLVIHMGNVASTRMLRANDYYRYQEYGRNYRYPRPSRHYGLDSQRRPYVSRNGLDYNFKINPREDQMKSLSWYEYYRRGKDDGDVYPTYLDYLKSAFKKRKGPDDFVCPLHGRTKLASSTSNSSDDDVGKPIDSNKGYDDTFIKAFDRFDRAIYNATFSKLSAMSFTQSGLLLYLTMAALSTTVDAETRAEIEQHCVALHLDEDKNAMLHSVVSSLPQSSDSLKIRWASRLVLVPGMAITPQFLASPAKEVQLKVHYFNMSDTPEDKTQLLNEMIEFDSGGALRDTFEVDEVSEGAGGALLSTLYVRARWRAAPTLLNGTRAFRDPHAAPAHSPRRVRMLRVNDHARYVHLHDWGAEAVELSYARRGLSLLLLVPREASLARVAARLGAEGLAAVTGRLQPRRVGVTMPLYTLRMTLLLPNKLKSIGISRLVSEPARGGNASRLWLSHAVQRVMFWSEAGRHAFKDDGIEWDEVPDKEMVVDCPYIFFVRWQNVSLLTGNFLL